VLGASEIFGVLWHFTKQCFNYISRSG